MKYYVELLWIFFVLALLSVFVGFIVLATNLNLFSLKPISFLRFSGLCLMFNIAFSLVQISLKNKTKA